LEKKKRKRKKRKLSTTQLKKILLKCVFIAFFWSSKSRKKALESGILNCVVFETSSEQEVMVISDIKTDMLVYYLAGEEWEHSQ